MQNKLQEYYESILKKNQLLREKKKTSKVCEENLKGFSLDIFILCNAYKKKVPTKYPWYDGELSDERIIQIKILELLLYDFAHNVIDENSFYRGVRYIYQHCTVTVILPTDLNDFKSRLEYILKKVDKQITAADFSTYARLEELVLRESTGILNKALLDYEEKLKNNSTLQTIEEKLKTISGKELCVEIIAQIKKEGGKKLLDLEIELQTRAKEIEENNQKMQQSMQLLTNELVWATDIILKYYNEFPESAQRFGADKFIADKLIGGDSVSLSSPPDSKKVSSESKKVRFLNLSSPLSSKADKHDVVKSAEQDKNSLLL